MCVPSLWGAAVHILAAVLSRGLAGALINRTGGTVWGETAAGPHSIIKSV